MASKGRRFSLIFHGGAGRISLQGEAPEVRYQRLGRILQEGYKYCLDESLSPIDIVEKVIICLENDSYFNAGKGSVYTNKGTHELDASIMDGKSLQCASVSLIKTIKNPITLAKHLLLDNINNRIPHSMIFGDGAIEYAKLKAAQLESLSNKNKNNKNNKDDDDGIVFVKNSYFDSERRFKQFKRAQEMNKKKNNQTFLDHDIHIKENENKEKEKDASNVIELDDKTSTVGCCVWIENLGCCAGTSTGGMTYKMIGRIGDSPIIGAGTYANDKTLSISGTGIGEEFIRNLSCFDVHARMLYKNENIVDAMKGHINDHFGGFDKNHQETGGFIGIDSKNGQIAAQFNSTGMNRGYFSSSMFEKQNSKIVGKVGVWSQDVDCPLLQE